MPPIKRPKPTAVVLGLLCVMYLITYVDRVNISTAADSIKRELALSNTQLGFLQSAFGYPYLIFQIFGGWIGDRFGPRRTLFLCGLIWATATILTGFSGGLVSLFVCRPGRHRRGGATFPGHACDAELDSGRGALRAGADARLRAPGQRAITPPIVAPG
jgi:MFS family permease